MTYRVDLLVLGAGWLSSFLLPMAASMHTTYAATTQDGRNETIKFSYDPESDDSTPFRVLPVARTVLITFPIKNKGGAERLVRLYNKTLGTNARYILLGSTGIWTSNSKADGAAEFRWTDRHSPFDTESPRASAEEELLRTTPDACILCLAGLWGGERMARNFLARVAKDKATIAERTSIHMIHGEDVSRGILAVDRNFEHAKGQRFILTDMRVYDWWDLVSEYGNAGQAGRDKPAEGPQVQWVRELMAERKIKSLPRSPEQLGRALTSVEFWDTVSL